MKYKLKDFWGQLSLLSEDGGEVKINGNLVKYGDTVGRLWVISDKGTTNGGHGIGSFNESQAILCTEDMGYIKIPHYWGDIYNINLLEE